MINEIWTTKLIYGEVCEDAKVIQKEVKRRRALYSRPDYSEGTDYNRLRFIGYDDNEPFSDCPYCLPGRNVYQIAGQHLTNLDVFIHAPFKKALVTASANKDRNVASIVAQYKLKSPSHQEELLLIEGGDADHYQWAEIKYQTEQHSNYQCLQFDIMLASHHCSWSFYNDRPYRNNKEPRLTSKELIASYARDSAFVVASSKEVVNNEDNPPHYPAKTEYIDDLPKSGTFLCTGEEPTRAAPKPVIFILSNTGVERKLPDANDTDSNSRTSRQRMSYLSSNPGIPSYGSAR